MNVTKYASKCKRYINRRTWKRLKINATRRARRVAKHNIRNGNFDFDLPPMLTGWDVI